MAKKDNNNQSKNLWYYRKEIGVGILLIITALFMIQNSQTVKFWFFSTMKVKLIFILLLFFLLGALTVWIYHFVNSRDKKKEIKRLNSQMNDLKEEVKTAYDKLKGGAKEEEVKSEDSDGKEDSDKDNG